MKRFDPAEHFGERHVRPADLARMLGVSLKTARRLMADHEDVLTLPRKGAAGKREYRSLTLPLSAAREIYVSMRSGKVA